MPTTAIPSENARNLNAGSTTLIASDAGIMGRAFVYSVCLCLILTATAKFLSSLGTSTILRELDPLLGIQFRYLFLLVAVLELLVACACVLTRNSQTPIRLIAWLSSTFLLYRLGLWCMNWHKPCGCLGILADALHLPPSLADRALVAILLYMLIGSYYYLFLRQWKYRTP